MPIYELNGKRPRIHHTARVLDGAVVAGDVVVGPAVFLSWGAIVYAEEATLEIARGVCIGDGALVHCKENPIRIGEFALIGHGAQVCAGSVEDFGRVGINAVVLEGACVVEDSMLAADSLLLPGKRTSPGMMWAGRPAGPAEELGTADKNRKSAESRAFERLQIFNSLLPIDLQSVRFDF